jgi:predicted aldo/keto reductase-like oxidoreductase
MREIKKRKLGRTNLLVTELGFGAMDITEGAEGRQTLARALDLGINYIDTARVYPNSEYTIGQVMKDRREQRHTVCVASKTLNRTRDGALRDLEGSLKHLSFDRIDLYQLAAVGREDWEQIMGKGGALQGLKEARENGIIDYIGISSHSVNVLQEAIASGEFDTVLLMYSPFNRETGSVISLAKETNIGVVVMKAMGGSGMLGTLRSSEQKTALTPPTLLRYALSNPDVSVVLSGMRFSWEVEENVELALSYEPVTEAEKSLFHKKADSLFSQPVL